MNKVTLQIPVNQSLKVSAEKAVLESGFSSLQEALRVIMAQLANKTLSINFFQTTPDETLTDNQEAILTKKYKQAKKDIAAGKGFVAHSIDEMMAQLRA